jgi:C_GCAxxG_C_C family probable redox protein
VFTNSEAVIVPLLLITCIPDIALGLGGGVGLQGHVCGAVSGASLVVSLAMAKRVPEYSARKLATFEAAGRVCEELERRFGSVECRQMCGLDLTSPQGLEKLICLPYPQALSPAQVFDGQVSSRVIDSCRGRLL